jgi:hypothetical protein
MQGIYTYIPETNRVPKQYNVAAILSLLFMVPTSLAPALALMYFYISTFRNMCAVPNMAVFCSSLTWWFPGMVFTYFQNNFEMVPVTQIITGITLIFTFNISCIYIVRLLLLLLLLLLLFTEGISRSQWPRGLRRRSTAVRLLQSWVQIPAAIWKFVCCVLSGRGLCDELITRPEESYRLWRVVVCDQETSWTRRP